MRIPITEIEDTAKAKNTPVSIFMNQASGPAGRTKTSKKVEAKTTNGAALKTTLSAALGNKSSFWRNFPTSAKSCNEP